MPVATKRFIINSHYIFFFLILTSISINTKANNSTQYFNNDQEVSSQVLPSLIYKDWIDNPDALYACPGSYQPIKIPNILKPEISADSFELSKQGLSVVTGNVQYLDKQNMVNAEQAKVYRDSKLNKVVKIEAFGNVEYRSPELRIISNALNIDVLNNTAYLNSPAYFTYYPNNARGNTNKAVLIKDKSYTIYNSSFTTCPPGDNAWSINSDVITIDPVKQIGTAKNTFLYFYNVPVFYAPYLRFPTAVKRESGFLTPIYSNANRYGYSLAIPYYFNLAPNYDATLITRYMTKRDWQFALETRHMNKFGNNQINIEYMPNDKEFSNFRNLQLSTNPFNLLSSDPRLSNLRHAKNYRYAINIKDSHKWTKYLSSNIDFNRLSDNQYFIDLPETNIIREDANGHLIQQLVVNYNYHNWRSEFLAKGFQTIHTVAGPELTEPYRILPSINLSNSNIVLADQQQLGTPFPVIASFDLHAMRFASPSNPKPDKLAEGQRYFAKPSISTPLKQNYGYITPKLSASIRHYDLNRLSPTGQILGYDMNQNYFIPIFSVDSGLYFDKNYIFHEQSLTHTLEPRLFYLNVPKRDQNQAPDFDIKQNTISYEQLFRDNNYSGYDRQSNANQLTTGLVSRLQNFNTGHELLKLQIGQGFKFQDTTTTICNQDSDPNCINTEIPFYQHHLTPLVSILDLNLSEIFHNTDRVYGQIEWQWDHYLNRTNKIIFGFHYIDGQESNKKPQTLLNLEYNFLKEGNIQRTTVGERLFQVNDKRNDLSTIESSMKIPVHKNLILLGFYSYDLRNQASLDRYLGAELQNCCWALRAGYRSQLRLRTNSLAPKKYDNIFTIQFSLKGLGEINQSFENVLRSNITGYQNQLDKIY